MSIIGTGAAAGVAQTAYQAQQVARQRDRDVARSAAEAKQLREVLEAHMRALEEGDVFESPAQLRVDGQLQEREQTSHAQPGTSDREQAYETSSQSPDVSDAEDSHPAGDAQLYRHLDIQA